MSAQTSIELGRAIYGVGVDPGATSAWALMTCGAMSGGVHVIAHGQGRPTGDFISSAYDRCWQYATKYAGRSVLSIRVAVEDQWTPKLKAGMSQTELDRFAGQISATVGVAASRGAWVALAEARGWPADVVHPATWRAAVGRLHGLKRKDVKAGAKRLIELMAPKLFRGLPVPRRVSDHLAEAILIGEYDLKRAQMENLQGARA